MEKEIIYRHKIPVQLRFSDVDRFGHVNNSIYFSLYDLGKTDYLHSVLPHDFEKQVVVPVIANINADFIKPIFFGDPIEIETATIHLGNKSFTLSQRAINTKTGEIMCQCQTIMVCFSLKEKSAVEIPKEVKEAIMAYDLHL